MMGFMEGLAGAEVLGSWKIPRRIEMLMGKTWEKHLYPLVN
jgi:hypothetical protein